MHVSFVCIHVKPSTRAVPLGAAMVAGSLKKYFKNSLSISIIDCYLTDSQTTNLAKITAGNPDCVCFSLYIWNIKDSLTLISLLKAGSSNIKIVVGGPQVTALPQYFADMKEIDHVFIGEAEYSAIPIFQLLLDKAVSIPKIIEQGKAPDLETLPSPYLENMLDLKIYNGALWELSRGCPFSCSFCFESRGNNGIRRFSIERIKQELELFQKAGIAEVFVLDPTFNFNTIVAKQILKAIAKIAPHIHYTFEIRAEFIDQGMANLFSKLHCTLQIGLQSINVKVLKNVNRRFNIKTFSEKVFLLHDVQVPYGFDLIYGLPEDTIEGFLESLDFVLSLAPNHVDIFPLAVLPGTVLYKEAQTFSLSYDPDNSYIVTQSDSFPIEDMEEAARIAETVDLFYNQGKAVTWLDILLPFIDMTPSAFFSLVSAHSEFLLDSKTPLEYQHKVIDYIFTELGLENLVDLIKCLISYFWLVNSIFPGDEIEKNIFDTYRLNPQIQLASFLYNPLIIVSLIEEGLDDFNEILDQVKPQKTNLVIYALDGEVQHLICKENEYEFLKAAYSMDNEKISELTTADGIQQTIKKFLDEGLIVSV